MHSAVYKILSAAMRLSFNNEVKKKELFWQVKRETKKKLKIHACTHQVH